MPKRRTCRTAFTVTKLTCDGGTGKPIIFVYGLLSNPASWNVMIDRFRDEGYFSVYQFWRFG